MSTLKVTNIQATGETASRAVSGVAAVWVNFNGTGTPAARDSTNVASITDNGTGDYSVNLTNAYSNDDHAYTMSSGYTGGGIGVNTEVGENRITSSVLGVRTNNTSFGAADSADILCIGHGDLA